MNAARAGAAVRIEAAKVLHAVRFNGASLKAALIPALAVLPDARDRALCEAIAFAGCRWLLRYEALLHRLLARPLPARAARVHALLLAGLAQLDTLRMPAYAVLDATAEAARGLDQPGLVGLVNAVLRRYLRETQALHDAIAVDPQAMHAHPAWLLQALQRDWPQHWPAIIDGNNREAPTWLRVNPRRCTPAEYLARLQAQGIDAKTVAALPNALCLTQGAAIDQLPGWQDGWVSVQDGAAQLAVRALDARPGQHVLDACAAPGGKTAALLENVDGIELLALDRVPKRLAQIEGGLQRLGLRCALRAVDAADIDAWWDGRPFERILLDAPCSATGVIRRQPDIKWHRRATDVPALAAEQARLLDALWPLLAPGGRLVYATCSLLADENARQVDAFLQRHPDARAVPLGAEYGHVAGAGRQRLPGEDGMDGFFYAALARV